MEVGWGASCTIHRYVLVISVLEFLGSRVEEISRSFRSNQQASYVFYQNIYTLKVEITEKQAHKKEGSVYLPDCPT